VLPRVFLPDAGGIDALVVSGEQGHHFARVLRVREGEQIVAVCAGTPWLCSVRGVRPDLGEMTLQPIEPCSSHEPRVRLTLIQSLAKGDKMDAIMQHGTELGCAEFVVYVADRSVVKWTESSGSKARRWNKIVREAAAQSQRDVQPAVTVCMSVSDLKSHLQTCGVHRVALCDEMETSLGIVPFARQCSIDAIADLAVCIGPEGGWSDDERQRLISELGAQPVTLGRRQLRTETAGLAALVAILAAIGEMEGN
jgi:16S rRNA (uracil1498-N3)-methyltransferase